MAEVTQKSIHKSVLVREVLEGLNLKAGDTVLDGTINGAGHSTLLCEAIGEEGTLVGIDLDKDALSRAEERLHSCSARKVLAQENFRNLDKVALEYGIPKFNAILLDLGFSSDQLEQSGRGFSFKRNEPLILSLSNDPHTVSFTARDILNEWEEEQIRDILHGYGEERFAGRIARKIVELRKNSPLETTNDLVRVVEQAVPGWYRFARIHPATKTFQALRITVNDEIDALREGLEKACRHLKQHGRLAVISFHSIEDRIVKRFFEGVARNGNGTVLTKKPITATTLETTENPRARSAKLRILEYTTTS